MPVGDMAARSRFCSGGEHNVYVMAALTNTSSRIGAPCDWIPVGCLYPLSARLDRRRDDRLYRVCRAANDSAGSGTLRPFAVTRCFGADVEGSDSSDESPLASSSMRAFLVDCDGSAPPFRFAEPPWAYLKKSSSAGSSSGSG